MILAIEILIGANLLKAWKISDPFSTSFLGVGLVAIIAMLTFLHSLDSLWMLVVAGANDPRCPIRQIDNYLGELERLGKPHEVYRFDAGHGSLVIEETIRQVEVALSFARRHVAP